jgi:hypothetical protein
MSLTVVAQTASSIGAGVISGAHESTASNAAHVPSATLIGNGVTQFAGITAGSAFGLFSFTFNVTNLGDKSVKRHLSSQTLLLSSDISSITVAGIDQTSSSLIDVKCLEVSGDTAWWSGAVFFYTPDPRVNGATNTQILSDVGAGSYVIGGKIINGIPEKRSLFLSGANVPEVSLNDAGSINSVLLPILGKSGTSFCKLHDAMFAGNADYLQLDTVNPGSNHDCVTGRPPVTGEVLCDIQWLAPDDSTPIGFPAPNNSLTFSNPPNAAFYDLASVTRNFVAGSVVIGP